MITSAVAAAEESLTFPSVFRIATEDGWQALIDLLDSPPPTEPNAALRNAMRVARQAYG